MFILTALALAAPCDRAQLRPDLAPDEQRALYIVRPVSAIAPIAMALERRDGEPRLRLLVREEGHLHGHTELGETFPLRAGEETITLHNGLSAPYKNQWYLLQTASHVAYEFPLSMEALEQLAAEETTMARVPVSNGFDYDWSLGKRARKRLREGAQCMLELGLG